MKQSTDQGVRLAAYAQPTPDAPASHRITLHPLDGLLAVAWEDNPRRHDLEAIRDSLGRFGYVQTMVYDDTSGLLVAGHGVLASLLLAREDAQSPPQRVVIGGDGGWAVPVLHVQLAKGEARAYTVADTRTRELGTWDETKLLAALRDIEAGELGLSGVGFAPAELDALMAKLGGDLPASFTELAADGEGPAAGAGHKDVTCPNCGHPLHA